MIANPRELVESTLVESDQSRAVQLGQDRGEVFIKKRQSRCEIGYDTLQHSRNSLLGSIEEEAPKVVSLEQIRGIEDPTSQIPWIYANE
jgi:hypothetical protein